VHGASTYDGLDYLHLHGDPISTRSKRGTSFALPVASAALDGRRTFELDLELGP